MNLTPVKTEYKGVVFRSKCEAMFARCLDLAGYLWEYEPDDFKTKDGWTPDFRCIARNSKKEIVEFLMEYKPDDVTDCYLEKTRCRIEELLDDGRFSVNTLVHVVCGSFFNQTRVVYSLQAIEGPWERSVMSKCFSRHFKTCAEYRFDLVNRGTSSN